MRTLKNYLFFAITLLGLVSFSSCDSEEKMEEHILEGHCWEGYLPIYNWDRTEYYSRFFFEPDGNGVEEVYVYDPLYDDFYHEGDYFFTWGWRNDDYAVLQLRYGSRWGVDYTCMALIDVSHTKLKGYFYKNMNDYFYDREHGYTDPDLYFELRTREGIHRYND